MFLEHLLYYFAFIFESSSVRKRYIVVGESRVETLGVMEIAFQAESNRKNEASIESTAPGS
jgi:hypothetical protein